MHIKYIWRALVILFFKRRKIMKFLGEIEDVVSIIRTVRMEESLDGKKITKKEYFQIADEIEDVFEKLKELFL